MRQWIWELRQGETILGTLTLKDQDMFWFTCDFTATPAFEAFRDIFAREARLIDSHTNWDEFEELYAQIGQLNLSLQINNAFDDKNVFLLHIRDSEASFRPLKSPWVGGWIDKPVNATK